MITSELESISVIEPAPHERVAVIGDIHGHLGEFLVALAALGVGFPLGQPPTWPDDLWVIQTGDQIHKGPDSVAVLSLRDELVAASSGRFIDLIGNHEAMYLRGPEFFPRTAGLGSSLRSDDHRRLAVAVRLPDGPSHLLTHAGLTRGLWSKVCHSTSSAASAALSLNRAWARHDPLVSHPGIMYGSRLPNFSAGPYWAHASLEVVASWDASPDPLPFPQVAGHSNPAHPRDRLRPSRTYRQDSSGHGFVLRPLGQDPDALAFAFLDVSPSEMPPPTGLVPYLLPAALPRDAALLKQ